MEAWVAANAESVAGTACSRRTAPRPQFEDCRYLSEYRKAAATSTERRRHDVEYRLEDEPEELAAVAKDLSAACEYIANHYDRFGLIPEVYGDLRPRLEELGEAFRKLAASD